MTKLTQTKRTLQDFEYLADDFDTEHHGGSNYIDKAIISGMVLLSHAYITKAGKIPQESKEGFKIHFPMLNPKEWYHIACAIIDFYLGDNVNSPYYKINLNKHNVIYKDFKANNNKYNDLKID